MMMQIKGIVRGKQIELERETGLPADSVVIVRVEPKRLSLDEKKRLVDLLCGVWASDASLTAIFSEIEQLRALALPREVKFHATS
jgi:hypothetical protein